MNYSFNQFRCRSAAWSYRRDRSAQHRAHRSIPWTYPAVRVRDLTLSVKVMTRPTQTTPQIDLWQRMLIVVKPYVAVPRATRPCATTKPPPMPLEAATDPRFDSSG
jgi:hypothetical protein